MTQRAIDGNYIYFVTANVQDRRWFFVTPERAAKLGQAIGTCCQLKRFDLLAYCILPNHLHLLVRKLSAEEVRSSQPARQRILERMRCGPLSDCALLGETRTRGFLFPHRRLSSRRSVGDAERFTLSELMKSVKGTFSRTLPKGKFWQHRSNFRTVETEAYLSNVVEYILYNYRKMNLAERYGRAPFVYVDREAIDRVFVPKEM